MASSRPGLPPIANGRPTVPAAAPPPPVSSARVTNILQNYSHEQVVHALMTQLREKEARLQSLSDERRTDLRRHRTLEDGNRHLRTRVASSDRSIAERDVRIAQLERRLAQRGNDDRHGEAAAQARAALANAQLAAGAAEAELRRLSDANAASERAVRARDERLSQLGSMLETLRNQVDEREREGRAGVEAAAQMKEELESVRGELAASKDENAAMKNSMEELEKKLKGKEWVVKSLQEDSHDQRGRETHLRAHIEKLNEKLEAYEEKFRGKGEDVPMLLARLKDSEDRGKDLQRQVRRLTNKKLNELVLRSKPSAKTAVGGPTAAASSTDEGDGGRASLASPSLLANSDTFDDDEEYDEDGTFASTVVSNRDDGTELFYAHSLQEEDVLSDFFSEVAEGVESLQGEGGLCCAQRQGAEGGLCCAQRQEGREDAAFPPASDSLTVS